MTLYYCFRMDFWRVTIILLLGLMTCILAGNTESLTYECVTNGSIIISSSNSNLSLAVKITNIIYENVTLNTSNCTNNFTAKHGKLTINSTCFSGLKSHETRIILLSIVNSSNNMTEHNLILFCPNHSSVNRSLSPVAVNDIVPIAPKMNSVASVDMMFKSEKADTLKEFQHLPDVSTVYIGDRFYMYLVYKGKQDYKIVPNKCIAYQGGRASVSKLNTNTSRVTLSTSHGCSSEAAKTYQLMENFHAIDNKTLYAEMYGFNFMSDSDITIVCDIFVCNISDQSSNCLLNQKNCTNAKGGRRKRSVTNEDNNIKVSRTLNVHNLRQVGSNARVTVSLPILIIALQVVIANIVTRQI